MTLLMVVMILNNDDDDDDEDDNDDDANGKDNEMENLIRKMITINYEYWRKNCEEGDVETKDKTPSKVLTQKKYMSRDNLK